MRHSFLDPSHHHDDGSFGGERLISERREAEGKCDGNAGKNEACHDAYEEDQEIEVAKILKHGLQQVKAANDERAGVSEASTPAAGTPVAFDDRLPAQIRAQVEVRAKYAGYIERQEDEVERQRRNEETRLPDDLDYMQVAGLSHEVRQKLSAARPATIGLAGRLPGMTPAAVSILIVHLKKRGYGARARVA